MPTLNPGRFLAPAVESILKQTVRDIELVIVDDGSTDGEIERFRASSPDPRIRVIRNDRNIGIGASYSVAIPTCSSPWIALIDSDDFSHPMRFELQLKALEVDTTLDAVTTTIEFVDPDGSFIETYKSFHSPDEIRAYAPVVMPIPHPSLMGKRELFARIGYRADVRSAADYDMVLRALEAGFKFGSVSLPLYRYRRHNTSTTTVKNREHLTFVCVTQVCAARRRAGRPESLDRSVKEAVEILGSGRQLSWIYRHFARESAREGDLVLASVHAAFSLRESFSFATVGVLLKYLFGALHRRKAPIRKIAPGFLKGYFGVLLLAEHAPYRRAGSF